MYEISQCRSMLPSLGFTINPAAFVLAFSVFPMYTFCFFHACSSLLPCFSERCNVFEGVVGALVVDNRRHRLVCMCV